MPILDLVDPRLAALAANSGRVAASDLARARAHYHDLVEAVSSPPNSHVSVRDVVTPARDEHPPVKMRIFCPAVEGAAPLPCVFWIQGGGYVLTSPKMDDDWCQSLVLNHGCVVVSTDWRRAPERPFPAASEDCYTGLSWLVSSAADLNVDAGRIVIAGQSSGGGSTASLALLVRDRGEFRVAHQMLIYPMLDDRNDTLSSHLVTDREFWSRDDNIFAWRAYLGDAYGTDQVSPYAAPSRMQDLSNSIPTSILTGELDLFRDENILYAMRLMAVGVRTELYVYPLAPHGFDRLLPSSAIARQFMADRDAVLRRAFKTDV